MFRPLNCLILAAGLVGVMQPAAASDACTKRRISATADVTVSDGSAFSIEAHYQSPTAAAIRHIEEEGAQLVVVEGPLAWIARGDRAQPGQEPHKGFALGHQYHAFALHFEEMVTDQRRSEVQFGKRTRSATSGDYLFGGVIHLIEGKSPSRPAGLLLELPDTPPITVDFSRWRSHSGVMLPMRVKIDDRERVFDYRYTNVEIGDASPLWFSETLPAPDLDSVQIYRLHRKLLAAHCLGDADLIAGLSTSETLVASRGELLRQSNDQIRKGFHGLFKQLNYTGYHDLVPPEIEVSAAGDIGWIVVNVRAEGSSTDSGIRFNDQWAWIMTVRKIGGTWLHSGNAATSTPIPGF